MAIWQYLTAGFLLIHGMLHAWVGSGTTKDSSGNLIGWSGQSWLLSKSLAEKTVRTIGIILWAVTTIGFIGAGIGVFVQQEWWRTLACLSAAIGFIVLVLSWDSLMPTPWYYIMGPILNAAILLALLVVQWPPIEVIGA